MKSATTNLYLKGRRIESISWVLVHKEKRWSREWEIMVSLKGKAALSQPQRQEVSALALQSQVCCFAEPASSRGQELNLYVE